MVKQIYKGIFTLLFCSLITLSNSYAGIIRDDVDDSLYTTLATDELYSGVGKMLINGRATCSGTMINSTWILTAAHCVAGTVSNINFTVGGSTYFADNWIVHEDWGNNADLPASDIALVELSSQVMGVTFAELYTGSSEGTIGTNVGFGATGTGLTGITQSAGTKRAGTNMIDFTDTTETILLQDFDQPGDPSKSTMGDPTPLAMEYLIASGDSGGGLFINEAGTTYLAGVHSFVMNLDPEGDVNFMYGEISGSTRVSSFANWINDKINPIPTPTPITLIITGLALLLRRKI